MKAKDVMKEVRRYVPGVKKIFFGTWKVAIAETGSCDLLETILLIPEIKYYSRKTSLEGCLKDLEYHLEVMKDPGLKSHFL